MRALAIAVAVGALLGCASPVHEPTGPYDPTAWSDGERPEAVGARCEMVLPDGWEWEERVTHLTPDAPGCGGLPCIASGSFLLAPGDVASAPFCSCRCSGPPEGDIPLCECPDGMACRDGVFTDMDSGAAGGYCVFCLRGGSGGDQNPACPEG